MNHDYAHCLDYTKDCPKDCFRAELQRDIEENRSDFIGVPLTYARLGGTIECKRVKDKYVPDMDVGKWTPVSEGLPEEHESIWAKAKGTERWSESMWEKQSDEVIVTELFEDGTTRTDTACTHDGEWYVKIKAVKRKIIAWMPLPKPYKEGQDERT